MKTMCEGGGIKSTAAWEGGGEGRCAAHGWLQVEAASAWALGDAEPQQSTARIAWWLATDESECVSVCVLGVHRIKRNIIE